MLAFLILYALLALAAAIVLQVNNASPWVELGYYIMAGLVWVVPAAALVSWMSRSPTSQSKMSQPKLRQGP